MQILRRYATLIFIIIYASFLKVNAQDTTKETSFDRLVKLNELGRSDQSVLQALDWNPPPPGRITGVFTKELIINKIIYNVAYEFSDESVCQEIYVFPKPKISQRTDCQEISQWIANSKLRERGDLVILSMEEADEFCLKYEDGKCHGYSFKLKEGN